jgi:predicted RNase H-like nuclease (RuvC/YqgF family)
VEEAVHVRLEQAEKNKNVSARMKEMSDEITQLQKDIVDQDSLYKEQQQTIKHLEKIVEDLLDRVVKAEEKARSEDATKQKATRSAVASQSEKQLANTIKALETQAKGLDKRIEELECIVDQLNDTSTQPASGSTAPAASSKEIK